MKDFLSELQRRHVYKVGATYAVAAWLLAQVVTQVLPVFDVSMLGQRILVLILIAGFPVALVLAWMFDLTPLGIVRTDAAEGSADTRPAAIDRRRSLDRRFNYLLGGLLLLALGYLVLEHSVLRRASSVTAASTNKSVAVLPFDNFGGDPKNAYFAEGLRDEILTKLAGLDDLKVISRTSADRYKSRPESLKTVGAELGVGAVLEGSVQMADDAVHVNVQLIDAQTDAHLWAQTYDRPLTHVFAVEGEVGLAVAQALHARLAPGQADALSTAPTTNSLAYDSLLKGESLLRQSALNNTGDDETYRNAAGFFEEAVQRDPQFVQAYARLAYAQVFRYWGDPARPAELLARGKAAVDQALTLAPDSAAAHLAYGYYYTYGLQDFSSAGIEFKRTLALQPQNTEVRVALSNLERRQGHWLKAREWLEQALPLDPRNLDTFSALGFVCAALRDYACDVEIAARERAIEPEGLKPIRLSVHANEALTGDIDASMRMLDSLPPNVRSKPSVQGLRIELLIFQRQFAAAAEALKALPHRDEDFDQWPTLALCYTRLGDAANAKVAYERSLKQIDALPPADRQQWQAQLTRALALAGLGRSDEAAQVTQQALASVPGYSQAVEGIFARAKAAEVYATMKRPVEAVKLLQALLSEYAGNAVNLQLLKLDPTWDPLREDPAFQKLLGGGEASAVSPVPAA